MWILLTSSIYMLIIINVNITNIRHLHACIDGNTSDIKCTMCMWTCIADIKQSTRNRTDHHNKLSTKQTTTTTCQSLQNRQHAKKDHLIKCIPHQMQAEHHGTTTLHNTSFSRVLVYFILHVNNSSDASRTQWHNNALWCSILWGTHVFYFTCHK